MFPSVNPANNFLPKAFQVKDTHIGNLASLIFSPYSIYCTSGFNTVMALVEVFIKFQILTPCSVPAATHYNLGLKANPKMVDPASNSLEGAERSLMSQTYNFLSFPPVAMYLPLGEMETPLMLAS